MGSVTLQQAVARSKAMKRAMRQYFYSDTGTKNSRTVNAIIYETLESIISFYSDNQCRDLCRRLLECEDITPKERQQLLTILHEK